MNKIDSRNNYEDNQDFTNNNNLIMANTRNNIPKNITDELLYFKNDILKDMKDQITRLNSKYIKRIAELEAKLKDTQTKSEVCYQKMSNITEGITNQKTYQQRFSELEKFQAKASESLMNNEFRIKNIDNQLHDTISKYDKIILDSILYPGIIGKKNEFQTFHDLIDFLLINMKKLLVAKDKENLEKKEVKNRMDETLEKFRGHITFCVNKVEDLNQEIINYDVAKIIKNFEELKNNHKECIKTENSIMKKVEENEHVMENINQKLTNTIKEKTQNLYMALRNEILDINNNMQMIQDKYNEYINDFELIKKDVDNNKIILYDIMNNFFGKIKGDNQMYNLFLNNKGNIRNTSNIDFGKIIYKGESVIKQYINGMLNLSDLNRSHSNNNKDNNVKNILSDVEMDLTKNKKKYLNLNIKNKKNLSFDYLNSEEANNKSNKEFYITKPKYKRKSLKSELMENKLFRMSKIPKIKHYNNLNILQENNGSNNHKISNSFINEMNENDDININDDINVIHSKNFAKDIKCEKKESKIFLKKGMEEEKKNEEKLFQYKSDRTKNFNNGNNKQINIIPMQKKEINSMTTRQRILSAKERNTNSFNNNTKNEMLIHNAKKINNNNFYLRNDKRNRLYSSKVISESLGCRQMDINFDDERFVQSRENKKLTKSINQIKGILPYKDRDYFQERVKKFAEFSYKRPNKKK